MIKYTTTKKTSGKNTCEILVLHHTGGGDFMGNMKYLANSKAEASCHYVVGQAGEIGKIGEDTDILWHCGKSRHNGREDLNRFAIGIEIVDDFSDIQRIAVEKLAIELIKKYNIKKENVVRHKDISLSGKIDPYDSFWNNKFQTWDDYKNYLFSKIELMGVYEAQFKKKYGKGNVFEDLDGALDKCIDKNGQIIAKEFFFLVMIGLERINDKVK